MQLCRAIDEIRKRETLFCWNSTAMDSDADTKSSGALSGEPLMTLMRSASAVRNAIANVWYLAALTDIASRICRRTEGGANRANAALNRSTCVHVYLHMYVRARRHAGVTCCAVLPTCMRALCAHMPT